MAREVSLVPVKNVCGKDLSVFVSTERASSGSFGVSGHVEAHVRKAREGEMLGEMSCSTLLHWETSWDELHKTGDGTVLAGSALEKKEMEISFAVHIEDSN